MDCNNQKYNGKPPTQTLPEFGRARTGGGGGGDRASLRTTYCEEVATGAKQVKTAFHYSSHCLPRPVTEMNLNSCYFVARSSASEGTVSQSQYLGA